MQITDILAPMGPAIGGAGLGVSNSQAASGAATLIPILGMVVGAIAGC